MAQDKERVATDGVYADGDLVEIPLVNLELGPSYRSQLRDMDSLVESVYRFGVLTPLWVEPHPTVRNKYVVFSGRRRYEAARLAAHRRAKESSSTEAIAVQVGRYTVPCRIFRNLRRAQQAVLSLMENVVRSNPSAQDTARAMAEARKLIEEEFGQKASVEDLITLFEGAARPGGKTFHRRHVYRLLRMAEMDEKVLEEARSHGIGADYLEALGRLCEADVQMGLIESIQRERLTRQEVRLLVNHILSLGGREVDLPSLIAEVRRECGPPAGPARGVSGGEPGREEGGGHAPLARAKPSEGATGSQAVALAGDHAGSYPTTDAARDRDLSPLGRRKVLGQDQSGPPDAGGTLMREEDVKAFPAADVLVGRNEGVPDPRARDQWFEEVEARFGQAEAARIKKALGKVPYTAQDKRLMRAMHMYKGILPEHLPNYLEMVKETMAEPPWFGRVVASSLELLGLLDQRVEPQWAEGRPGTAPLYSRRAALYQSFRRGDPHERFLRWCRDLSSEAA